LHAYELGKVLNIRLENKNALVTGGASGIGESICRLFAESGARVAIADIDTERAERLASSIGDGAIAVKLDVSKEDDWEKAVDVTIGTFGSLDILVNNAGSPGAPGPKDPEHVTLEDWHEINDVNLDGTVLGCRAAIRAMKGGSGSIINVSSLASENATPMFVAYGAGKAAVRHLTKSVALYCAMAGYRIRCNGILPGLIATPMAETALRGIKLMHDDEDLEAVAQRMARTIPIGRIGWPEDIARAAVFLASDDAGYISGVNLAVDGGIRLASVAPGQQNIFGILGGMEDE
jgi:NAD(P)-dependent dehydrogenase (short-subunit alcohol dehydrogenase family)